MTGENRFPLKIKFPAHNMDLLDEFLIGIQVLVALASIPLLYLSRRTTRANHSRHESFMAVAIFLLGVAALVTLIAMYGLGTTNHNSFMIAVLLPILPAILCLIVVVRASQANAISRRRNRSSIGSYVPRSSTAEGGTDPRAEP